MPPRRRATNAAGTSQPGLPGQEATKLFGYIRDTGPGATATVHYGSGVTGVTDIDGNSAYTVAFDRGLAQCVVLAVSGSGDPSGIATGNVTSAFVSMSGGGPNEVLVTFENGAGTVLDTSFLMVAFC